MVFGKHSLKNFNQIPTGPLFYYEQTIMGYFTNEGLLFETIPNNPLNLLQQ